MSAYRQFRALGVGCVTRIFGRQIAARHATRPHRTPPHQPEVAHQRRRPVRQGLRKGWTDDPCACRRADRIGRGAVGGGIAGATGGEALASSSCTAGCFWMRAGRAMSLASIGTGSGPWPTGLANCLASPGNEQSAPAEFPRYTRDARCRGRWQKSGRQRVANAAVSPLPLPAPEAPFAGATRMPACATRQSADGG